MPKVLPFFWLTAALWISCGERSDDPYVCDKAIEKWNACAEAVPQEQGVPQISWGGLCADGVTFKTSTGSWEVPLRSWSEEYMDCKHDPLTCLCPGMKFIVPEAYDPK